MVEQANKIKQVLFVMAMQEEANNFITRFGLTELDQSHLGMPTRFYRNATRDGLNIGLVVSGVDPRFRCAAVGTTPAVLATYLGIETFKPEIVVNAGTCGGFKAKGCAMGISTSDPSFEITLTCCRMGP